MKIKINVNCGSTSQRQVGLAIKQVLSTLMADQIELVDSPSEADLLIVDDAKKVGAAFQSDKHYAIVTMPTDEPVGNLPANARAFPVPQLVVQLTAYIGEIEQELELKAAVPDNRSIPGKIQTKESASRYNVLVVDDNLGNLRAAQEQLGAEHELTVTSTYDDAMSLLSGKKYDIVLLDLHLPMSPKTLAGQAFKLGEQVSYGWPMLIQAGMSGAGAAAVVTDINHHHDAMSAAFDAFSGKAFNIEKTKCLLLHAPMTDGGKAKDWARALKALLEA